MAETPKNTKTGSKKDDYIVQGAILAAAAVLTKIIGVVYRIPLTNILGDEGNGFYGYAYQVYAIALMLSSFSLPTAVSKLVSARMAVRQRRNAFRVFLCSLAFAVAVGLVISLAIFFGAGAISTYAMRSPLSVYALRVLAPGLLIVAVMAVIRGYFQGLGTMVPTAISQILEQVVNAVVSIVGASVLIGIGTRAGEASGEELLGPAYGAAGSTLGTVMGSLAGLLFVLFVLWLYRGGIRRQLKHDRTKRVESYSSLLKALLFTAIPIVFSTAIYNINQIIDLTIFNHIMSSQGYVEQEYMALQGIYTGKYDTLINVPMAIANALGASVVPSLTAAVANGTKQQVNDKINQTLRLTMLIAIPSCVGYFVLASPIMVLLYNDDSATPAQLLMMGSIVVVLYGLSSVSNSILHGLNRMTAPAKNAGISLVVHLAAFCIMMTVLPHERLCAGWRKYRLLPVHVYPEPDQDQESQRIPDRRHTYVCKTVYRRGGHGNRHLRSALSACPGDRRKIHSGSTVYSCRYGSVYRGGPPAGDTFRRGYQGSSDGCQTSEIL